MNKSSLANIVIDRFGGTSVVAELCDVGDSAVSGWRTRGVPKGRLDFLKTKRPELFEDLNGHLPARKYAVRNRRRGRPPRCQGAQT